MDVGVYGFDGCLRCSFLADRVVSPVCKFIDSRPAWINGLSIGSSGLVYL